MTLVRSWLAVAGCLILLAAAPAAAAKRPPAQEPDLRIIRVALSPEAYAPGNGTLEFSVDVDLPSYLDGTVLLEVSSLISSPSKRSVRFLSQRRPLTVPQPDNDPPVTVTLTWDGRDQHGQVVGAGRYDYEIRVKLLTVGEKGPRTFMQSWPRRGVIEVK